MNSSEPGVLRLYLLRHAHAASPLPGQRDFDRRLDVRGQEEAAKVVRQAEAFGVLPDRIVTSAASRCQETAAYMTALRPDIVPEIDERLYTGTPDIYLSILDNPGTARSIMIVGHNPVIEELAELLVGSQLARIAMPFGFPTAGLLAVDVNPGQDPRDGQCLARFIITPSFSERF